MITSIPNRQSISRRRDGKRTLLAAAFALVLSHGAVAQDDPAPLVLRIESSVNELELCEELAPLEVTLTLENPDSVEVAGFQVFLGFPATQVELVEFRGGVLADVVTNGPPDFGSGFDLCSDSLADPWDDGSGTDMFAAISSVMSSAEVDALAAPSATLGTIVFRALPDAAGGSGGFAIPDEGCGPFVGQTVGFFDSRGEMLPLEIEGASFDVAFSRAVTVSSLRCEFDELTGSVELGWERPAAAGIEGFAIYKNGEVLFPRVPAFSRAAADTDVDLCVTSIYEIAVVRTSGEESCRVACEFGAGGAAREFVRGDANDDGSVNISDPIRVLGFQFRGQPVTCPDALDIDDSGEIDISDAIRLLTYLFLEGEILPAPFPAPGVDPTGDDLCCS